MNKPLQTKNSHYLAGNAFKNWLKISSFFFFKKKQQNKNIAHLLISQFFGEVVEFHKNVSSLLQDQNIYHIESIIESNIYIKCVFCQQVTDYCGRASAEVWKKKQRGIYYPVLKFTPKELAFHRSCMLTFPTAKNVIEGLRQRIPVVFNQAFKIFDISSDVATGWHPED